MGGLLHLVQRGGPRRAAAPPMQSPNRCTKCNSPPINGQCTSRCIAIWWLLCGFNVAINLRGGESPGGDLLETSGTFWILKFGISAGSYIRQLLLVRPLVERSRVFISDNPPEIRLTERAPFGHLMTPSVAGATPSGRDTISGGGGVRSRTWRVAELTAILHAGGCRLVS